VKSNPTLIFIAHKFLNDTASTPPQKKLLKSQCQKKNQLENFAGFELTIVFSLVVRRAVLQDELKYNMQIVTTFEINI